jgi:hypothetical protein
VYTISVTVRAILLLVFQYRQKFFQTAPGLYHFSNGARDFAPGASDLAFGTSIT